MGSGCSCAHHLSPRGDRPAASRGAIRTNERRQNEQEDGTFSDSGEQPPLPGLVIQQQQMSAEQAERVAGLYPFWSQRVDEHAAGVPSNSGPHDPAGFAASFRSILSEGSSDQLGSFRHGGGTAMTSMHFPTNKTSSNNVSPRASAHRSPAAVTFNTMATVLIDDDRAKGAGTEILPEDSHNGSSHIVSPASSTTHNAPLHAISPSSVALDVTPSTTPRAANNPASAPAAMVTHEKRRATWLSNGEDARMLVPILSDSIPFAMQIAQPLALHPPHESEDGGDRDAADGESLVA